jgi:hypothetical protein
MGQSTGEIIRDNIKNLLVKEGYKTTEENIDFIYSKHLGDSQDRPLKDLISLYAHDLREKKTAIIVSRNGHEIEFQPKTLTVNQYKMVHKRTADDGFGLEVTTSSDSILLITGNMPPLLLEEIEKTIKSYCNH